MQRYTRLGSFSMGLVRIATRRIKIKSSPLRVPIDGIPSPSYCLARRGTRSVGRETALAPSRWLRAGLQLLAAGGVTV